MLLWTDDLRGLGFRYKAGRYWRCDRGYGLDDSSHISLFLWTTHARVSAKVACYDVAEFHVTFEVPGHNVHFYYHEILVNKWSPAGHTSTAELALMGLDSARLRLDADEIAGRLIDAVGGELCDRRAI